MPPGKGWFAPPWGCARSPDHGQDLGSRTVFVSQIERTPRERRGALSYRKTNGGSVDIVPAVTRHEGSLQSSSEKMTKKKVQAAEGSESVDAYIADCPETVRGKLEAIRAAIREVAPDATGPMSYFQIPGYSYLGYDYNGMFV
jgi:hypothetical protein